MQLTIQIPDNLPSQRAFQRIRELEDSLREEARFFDSVLGKAKERKELNDPWNDPGSEVPAIDTGIEDFALHHDHYLYGSKDSE